MAVGSQVSAAAAVVPAVGAGSARCAASLLSSCCRAPPLVPAQRRVRCQSLKEKQEWALPTHTEVSHPMATMMVPDGARPASLVPEASFRLALQPVPPQTQTGPFCSGCWHLSQGGGSCVYPAQARAPFRGVAGSLSAPQAPQAVLWQRGGRGRGRGGLKRSNNERGEEAAAFPSRDQPLAGLVAPAYDPASPRPCLLGSRGKPSPPVPGAVPRGGSCLFWSQTKCPRS